MPRSLCSLSAAAIAFFFLRSSQFLSVPLSFLLFVFSRAEGTISVTLAPPDVQTFRRSEQESRGSPRGKSLRLREKERMERETKETQKHKNKEKKRDQLRPKAFSFLAVFQFCWGAFGIASGSGAAARSGRGSPSARPSRPSRRPSHPSPGLKKGTD